MNEYELWNEIGNLYFLSGNYGQAALAYTKSIQCQPGFGKPYSNLAMVYTKQENYLEAIRLYKQGLELLTDDAEKAIAWDRLGNVYRHLQEYQEAVSAYQHADELRTGSKPERDALDQALYATSDADSLPFETVDMQLGYQNHSDEYLHQTEPENDKAIPEGTPVEAKVPLNEIKFDWYASRVQGAKNNPGPFRLFPSFESEASVSVAEESKRDLGDSLADIPVIQAEQMPIREMAQETSEALDEFEAPENVKTPVVVVADDTPEEDTPETEFNVLKPIAQAEEVASSFNEWAPPNMETDLSGLDEGRTPGFYMAEPAEMEEEQIPTNLFGSVGKEFETETFTEEEISQFEDSPVMPAAPVEDGSDPEFLSAPASDDLSVDSVYQTTDENTRGAEKEIRLEEEKLTKQIEINPRNPTSWEALGTLYKASGRYDEAADAFKQAIALAPGKVSYYHNLGLVYSAQGNGKEAFNAFHKVIEIDPNHGLAHASLGGYYKKMGLDELAQKHIGKAMKQIYESENEYNRACLDAICGNVDEAISLLRTALENEQTYVDWVLRDPDLDALRGDDRFKQLIADFIR